MCFLNGIVVGVLPTIGAAYMHDRSVTPAADGTHHELVKWGEFGRGVGEAIDGVQAQFNRARSPP